MNKSDKVKILAEFKEQQELKKMAEKRISEIKKAIEEDIAAGVYGDYVLTFERREVKAYSVPARVDQIIKVAKI